jgi:plastocyanin
MRRIVIVAVVAGAAAVLALPASAATPSFAGSVGPGFTITMAKKPTKAGKITLVVNDKASIHNFHLRGPGGKEISGTATAGGKTKTVKSIATSVGSSGKTTFVLTLKKGSYTFVCDPHASQMKGSFTVK